MGNKNTLYFCREDSKNRMEQGMNTLINLDHPGKKVYQKMLHGIVTSTLADRQKMAPGSKNTCIAGVFNVKNAKILLTLKEKTSTL